MEVDFNYKVAKMTRLTKEIFKKENISDDEMYIILSSLTRDMEKKNPMLKMVSSMTDSTMRFF